METPCSKCGWNDIVALRRREAYEQYGLTRCPDGLYRLVIPAEAGVAYGEMAQIERKVDDFEAEQMKEQRIIDQLVEIILDD